MRRFQNEFFEPIYSKSEVKVGYFQKSGAAK